MQRSFFESAWAAVQTKVTGYANVASDTVGPWFQRFLMNAVPLIEREQGLGVRCEIPDFRPGGVVQPCDGQSCLRCVACLRPTCMGHAFVSHMAETICWECVVRQIGVARQMSGQRAPGAGRPFAPPGARPNGERPPEKKEVEWVAIRRAYQVLGIKIGTGKRAAQVRYRKLLVDSHPDKAPADERAAYEARFKEIRAAWDLLQEKVYREAAA